MSKILEGLYLGCVLDANNRSNLKRCGVTHILNVAYELPAFHCNDFIYKKVVAYDCDEFDLSPYFDEIADFIYEGRKSGGVLVHCMFGISRSTTSVIAYQLKYENMKFRQAMNFITNKRKIAHPNSGFQEQLRKYKKQLDTQNGVDDNDKNGSMNNNDGEDGHSENKPPSQIEVNMLTILGL